MISGIKEAAKRIKDADAVLITAGSGMSADSGLATFRGAAGLYESEDINVEELINPIWFRRDPESAWTYYWSRIREYLSNKPHQGYSYLLEMVKKKPNGYFVFTSNVDGFFQKSGYSKNNVYECHGNIYKFQCSMSCGKDIWDLRDEYSATELEALATEKNVLNCPNCGAVARPNVLMFNDGSWISRSYWDQQENYRRWQLGLRGKNIVKLEIGAGTEVATVRDESEIFPGILVRINPEPGELPYGSIAIEATGLKALQQLSREVMIESIGPE